MNDVKTYELLLPCQSTKADDPHDLKAKTEGVLLSDYKELEEKNTKLRDLLYDNLSTMKHARFFIGSRQKMHPTGIDLYEENMKETQSAIEKKGE
jgi:hypothetical protein